MAQLEKNGAELVRFSPIHDQALPAVDGLYFGGGYPELAARGLAQNRSMIEAVHRFASAGGAIYAECGGLMYLTEGIRTLEGTIHAMAGLVPGVAIMHNAMQALGYVEVETTNPSFLGPSGTRWRGHQFRYSSLEGTVDDVEKIFHVVPRWGAAPVIEGYRRDNVIASYVHAHWASNLAIPMNFVDACTVSRERRG